MKALDPIQQSALSEVGNIGAGHVASTLADLVGHRVSITVPKVWVASPANLPEGMNHGVPMVATHFKVLGEPSGGILFALTKENASKLLGLILEKQTPSNGNWTELEFANLKEAGLILCASYLEALNQLMYLRLIPSIPKILSGDLKKVLEGAFLQPANSLDGRIGVLNQFREDSSGLEAFFFFVPEPEGLHLILERLGVLVSK